MIGRLRLRGMMRSEMVWGVGGGGERKDAVC